MNYSEALRELYIDNEYNAKLRKEAKKPKEMEIEMSIFGKHAAYSPWYTYTDAFHPRYGL